MTLNANLILVVLVLSCRIWAAACPGRVLNGPGMAAARLAGLVPRSRARLLFAGCASGELLAKVRVKAFLLKRLDSALSGSFPAICEI